MPEASCRDPRAARPVADRAVPRVARRDRSSAGGSPLGRRRAARADRARAPVGEARPIGEVRARRVVSPGSGPTGHPAARPGRRGHCRTGPGCRSVFSAPWRRQAGRRPVFRLLGRPVRLTAVQAPSRPVRARDGMGSEGWAGTSSWFSASANAHGGLRRRPSRIVGDGSDGSPPPLRRHANENVTIWCLTCTCISHNL